MQITITVPNGYEEMAARYALEAIEIAVREDKAKLAKEADKEAVEAVVATISAVDDKGVDLLKTTTTVT